MLSRLYLQLSFSTSDEARDAASPPHGISTKPLVRGSAPAAGSKSKTRSWAAKSGDGKGERAAAALRQSCALLRCRK
jgi:hypothetical protein